MVPLLTVRYESIIGSYLGETASRLSKLFEYAKTRQCVLFFDEFETLGKERGDIHETAWRRFQIRLEIPKPTRSNLEEYYRFFEKERDFKFGLQPSTLAKKTLGISYAEAEEFALSVYRQYVLNLPNDDPKKITEAAIHNWQAQVIDANANNGGVETCPTDL